MKSNDNLEAQEDAQESLFKIMGIVQELKEDKLSLTVLDDLIRINIHKAFKTGMEELLKAQAAARPPQSPSPTGSPIDRAFLKKAGWIAGGTFLLGLLVSYASHTLSLKPLEKKINHYHTLGILLEKAWPKLTDKEQARLKKLF
jgi:hypothetical protein